MDNMHPWKRGSDGRLADSSPLLQGHPLWDKAQSGRSSFLNRTVLAEQMQRIAWSRRCFEHVIDWRTLSSFHTCIREMILEDRTKALQTLFSFNFLVCSGYFFRVNPYRVTEICLSRLFYADSNLFWKSKRDLLQKTSYFFTCDIPHLPQSCTSKPKEMVSDMVRYTKMPFCGLRPFLRMVADVAKVQQLFVEGSGDLCSVDMWPFWIRFFISAWATGVNWWKAFAGVQYPRVLLFSLFELPKAAMSAGCATPGVYLEVAWYCRNGRGILLNSWGGKPTYISCQLKSKDR